MAMQQVIGKIVEIRKMSVKGADLTLPTGSAYYVNLRLDYSDVTEEELLGLASAGSSVRVKAQAQLRKDEELLMAKGDVADSAGEAAPSDWIEYNVATDFESEAGGPRDPEKTAKSAFKKMDNEQKAKFISETLGVDIEAARKMI